DEFCRDASDFDVTGALPQPVVATTSAGQAKKGNVVVPLRMTPELAIQGTIPTDDDKRWVYELKFDGYRLLTRREGDNVQLFTRNGHDWTSRMPKIAEAVKALPFSDGWLDGELVYLDDDGSPNFNELPAAIDKDDPHLRYFLFDALWLNGQDMRGTTLTTRYAALSSLLKGYPESLLRLSEQFAASPKSLLASACKMGLEGLVAKRKDSTYTGQRSGNWIKLKCSARQEFVVIGFVPSAEPGRYFKSLLVAEHDTSGALVYAGNVGTGFTPDQSKQIHAQLSASALGEPLLTVPATLRKAGHWVVPALVVEVKFGARTKEGHLRHAVFRGIRLDKSADEVIREMPLIASKKFSVTHADRVVDPSSGATKGDIADYYALAQALLLKALKDRPCALVRAPSGLTGTVFFQKHSEAFNVVAAKVLTAQSGPNGGAVTVVSSFAALGACVQNNAIEFHTVNARLPLSEKPDRIIFDLDPGDGVAWLMIQEAAVLLKSLLDELGLPAFLKTSGGKGLHVVVPIMRRYSWAQTKAFSGGLVRHLAQVAPSRFVAKIGPKNRVGKIYVDYLRNGSGATTAAAWTLRARQGLPVSVPISWDELDTVSSSDRWTIRNVAARLRDVGDEPWKHYGAPICSLGEAAKRLGIQIKN
ncbi:MAG: DNA ligase D, partial [Casimicrobium sp.]